MSLETRVYHSNNLIHTNKDTDYYIIQPIGLGTISQFTLSLEYNLNIVQKKDRPLHKDKQYKENHQKEKMYTTIYITQEGGLEIPVVIWMTNPLYSFRELKDPDNSDVTTGRITKIRIPIKGPDGSDYNLGFKINWTEI